MEMVYKFREGSRLKGDPQAVGNMLTEIRAKRGHLVAADVVQEAMPKESPLHAYFEWNRDKAAELFRLHQARHLIAAVVVVETSEHGEIPPIRAWCKLTGAESYEPIDVVLSSPEMRARALREVKLAINSLKEKLATFEGFSAILAGLDEVDAVVEQHIEQTQAGAPA